MLVNSCTEKYIHIHTYRMKRNSICLTPPVQPIHLQPRQGIPSRTSNCLNITSMSWSYVPSIMLRQFQHGITPSKSLSVLLSPRTHQWIFSAKFPFSSPPYLHHRSNALSADGADVDLLRAMLARRHMPAVVKKSVHLFFIAYITHGHFLVRNLKLHRPLAMPFPLFEPTDVDVSRFGVNHLTLPVRLVRLPLSGISVAVRVRHDT